MNSISEIHPPLESADNVELELLTTSLRAHAVYKSRSAETNDADHAPVLAQKKPITCLLLGHSFFERFKTTGKFTQFGPDQAPYPEYFNAGVGGDRISNVIYRLTEKGLLDALGSVSVKYALLAMGTNDLQNDRKALQPVHIEQYMLLIQALQSTCPGVKLLVCAIAPRRKVRKEGIVDESNSMLEEMVQKLVEENSGSVVEFLPANPNLINCLEPDGVHLNEEGYKMFSDDLWRKYQDMRAKYELSCGDGI